jgi:hypothetical protein
MRMSFSVSWGAAAPYLAGTYEHELHEVFERFIAQRPDRAVVVGCADGYYAVGLAVRLPNAHIIAFEADPIARRTCRRTSRANDVQGRIEVRGRCNISDLDGLLEAGDLLVCDVEGAELDLIDPARVPVLHEIDGVVELHDFVDPATTTTLSGRFPSASVIEANPMRARPPHLAHLSDADIALAMEEWRPESPPMRWLVLERDER